MRKPLKRSSLAIAIFFTTIMLLPVIVSAETTTEITVIVDLPPAMDNYDEKVNIANDSIVYNVDTWNPLPVGRFVGGITEESSFQLSEWGYGGEIQLLLATEIEFQNNYLYGGSSICYIRLPLVTNPAPNVVHFFIYEITGDYTVNVFDYDHHNEADWNNIHARVTGNVELVFNYEDVANYGNSRMDAPVPFDCPYYPSPLYQSYVSDERIYLEVAVALYPNINYLFVTTATYDSEDRFKFYVCSSDLGSDNITSSTISYYYEPGIVGEPEYIFKAHLVDIDLGWSFVFTEGIGGVARSFQYQFYADDQLNWEEYIRVDSDELNGSFNFIFEFETEYGVEPLNFSLAVEYIESDWGAKTVLDMDYWEYQKADGFIIASNPINQTYDAHSLGGNYYILFYISLRFNEDIKLNFIIDYDNDAPFLEDQYYTDSSLTYGNKFYLAHWLDPGYDDINEVHYGIRASLSINNYTINKTALPPEVGEGKNLLDLLFEFAKLIWIDGPGGLIYYTITGDLISTYYSNIIGTWAPLFLGGVTYFLYRLWPTIADAWDRFWGMIIDGLNWLGEWIWKIASWIWDALVWLADQLIYYGAILLGMLLVAVAIFIFGFALQIQITFWKMILALVDGDLEKVEKQAGKLTGTIKGMAGR